MHGGYGGRGHRLRLADIAYTAMGTFRPSRLCPIAFGIMLQVTLRSLVVLGIWIGLLLIKLPFGYALKAAAFRYTEMYNSAHQGKVHPRSVAAVSTAVGAGRGGMVGNAGTVSSSRRETPRGEGSMDTLHQQNNRQKQE